jgi:hypothetical protein
MKALCFFETRGSSNPDIERKSSGDQYLNLSVVLKPTLFLYVTSYPFLGASAELGKVTIYFVISVHLPTCLSVRTEQIGSQWADFHEI